MAMTVDPAVTRKLGLKPGMRVLLLGAPEGYREGLGSGEPGLALEVPGDATRTGGDSVARDATPSGGAGRAEAPTHFDAVQLFCRDRADLERLGPAALEALRAGGLLWACYPKGTSKMRTDLGRDVDWGPLAAAGYRAVGAVSIDDTWSALRFRQATEAVPRR